MACITLQSGYKVILSLAGCLRTIVATAAVACGVGVIKTGRYPCSCTVAVTTGITAGNMCCCFACGDSAIVAAIAGAGYISVINIGRCPGIG